MNPVPTEPTLSELLSRVIDPGKPDLSHEPARYLSELRFPPADQRRLKELAEKQHQGRLTEAEELEMDGYIQAADLIEVLKAKARASPK